MKSLFDYIKEAAKSNTEICIELPNIDGNAALVEEIKRLCKSNKIKYELIDAGIKFDMKKGVNPSKYEGIYGAISTFRSNHEDAFNLDAALNKMNSWKAASSETDDNNYDDENDYIDIFGKKEEE